MNAARIRGFLLQLPKPHTVRVTGEGEPQDLKPGKSYAKLAETIVALSPDLLECLDSGGKILRAIKLDQQESHRSDAAAVPPELAGDPQAAMMTHFANLLHRAYEHSTEIAFVKLVEVFDIVNERSASIEQRLERTEALNRRLADERREDAIERAEEQAEAAVAAAASGGGDLLTNIAGAFLNGQALGATGAKPPVRAQPNGGKT